MPYRNRTFAELSISLVTNFAVMIIFAILISVFFVDIAAGRVYIPSLVNGQTYAVNLPYNIADPLHHFIRQGNTVMLYSNCVQLSGCNFWGLWTTPFQLTQNIDGSYTAIFTTATVVNEYKFVPIPDGGVDVFAKHDQCYPTGCQNPLLQYVGQFN